MSNEPEIELPWEMQEIVRLLKTELRIRCERVEETSSLSREGRIARAPIESVVGQAPNLAKQSGSQLAIDGVAEIRLPTFGCIIKPEQLPNCDSGRQPQLTRLSGAT